MFATFYSRSPDPRADSGMTLIEVLVSALLVALIAIGTFTGLTVATKFSGNERAHAQAASIAQQNEERLRGEYIEKIANSFHLTETVSEGGLCVEQASARTWRYISKAALSASATCEKSALAEASAGASYTGTVFTVTSMGESANPTSGASACEVESASAEVVKTTSSVTWTANKGKEVTQSSLVKLPSNYAVLVKVKNRNKEPVAGATVSVKTAAGALLAPQQTTPASGCVVVGNLKQTAVDVDVEKEHWVDPNGKSPPPAQEKTLSKTSLTTAEFTIEASGTILAEFESNGKAVSSFTFEALHPEGMTHPEDLVGPEGITGDATVAPKAELQRVFPFEKSPYKVFAGACEKNNPKIVAGIEPPPVQVEPNTTEYAKVEAPEVKTTVYEGESSSKPGSPLAKSYSAVIKNTGCLSEAAKSQNYSTAPDEYKAEISSGELIQKYLPYAAELELCVVGDLSGTYYKNTFKITNTKKTGSSFIFYLKSGSPTKTSSAQTC
jgi:type II secretory pathway pseudopilin PulG